VCEIFFFFMFMDYFILFFFLLYLKKKKKKLKKKKKKMPDTQEKVLYQGGPSQMLNANIYFMCAVMLLLSMISVPLWKNVLEHAVPQYKGIYLITSKAFFFISIYWAIKSWLEIKSHKYKISTERLSESEGIFSRTTHELELFRVRDITFSEPFSLRMIGCGDIILNTTDKTTPIVVIHGVKDARAVMEILRRNVDIMRTRKGVREIEM
jgi:uncharacterized membrane protein YdbT with pleckstrin-like domain